MYIIQLYSGHDTSTGDYIYRIDQTTKGLSSLKNIFVDSIDLLNVSNKEVLVEAPLLILHHLSDPDLLPVISERKKRKLPTIYELADNFKFSQEHKSERRRIGPPAYYIIIEEMLRRCNAIQVNNPQLKERYSYLNKKFIIVPNYLETCQIENSNRKRSEKLTIGWGGSARHLADLKHFSGALIDWVSKNPDVRLAVMGAKSIHRIFKKISSEQLCLCKPGSLKEYFSFLMKIDIGIAPLLPTEFNACRSDVKFLEYASCGVAPLCSRFGPYLRVGEESKSVLLFSDAEEFIAQLDSLKTNSQLREKIAKNAHAWVMQNRISQPHHWVSVIEKYTELAPKVFKNSGSQPEFNNNNLSSRIARSINLALNTADIKSSLAQLKQTISVNFNNYQVYYFYGWALCNAGKYKEAIDSLKKALEIRPDSIRTLELLTRIFLLNQEVESALHAIDSALKFEPHLPTLLNLKAAIFQLGNRHRKAFAILEQFAHKTPEYVEAQLAYTKSAIVLGKLMEAERSVKQLHQMIPESPEVFFYSAIIAQNNNDLEMAHKHLNTALNFDPEHHKSRKLLQKIMQGNPAFS